MSAFEVAQLRKILPAYIEHFRGNPDSLLTRICGLYSVEDHGKESDSPGGPPRASPLLGGGQDGRTYFVIMSNVLHSRFSLHERYDLKGSTVGRATGKATGRAELRNFPKIPPFVNPNMKPSPRNQTTIPICGR